MALIALCDLNLLCHSDLTSYHASLYPLPFSHIGFSEVAGTHQACSHCINYCICIYYPLCPEEFSFLVTHMAPSFTSIHSLGKCQLLREDSDEHHQLNSTPTFQLQQTLLHLTDFFLPNHMT